MNISKAKTAINVKPYFLKLWKPVYISDIEIPNIITTIPTLSNFSSLL